MTPAEVKVFTILAIICILFKILDNTSDLKKEIKNLIKELEELKKAIAQKN